MSVLLVVIIIIIIIIKNVLISMTLSRLTLQGHYIQSRGIMENSAVD